jgi:ankyrin repeat protein
MREWAIANPGRLNDHDCHGRTLLSSAAFHGSPSFVAWLLEKGADVRASAKNGRTALHLARSAETISILLAAGADPVALDKNGQTPPMGKCMNPLR